MRWRRDYLQILFHSRQFAGFAGKSYGATSTQKGAKTSVPPRFTCAQIA